MSQQQQDQQKGRRMDLTNPHPDFPFQRGYHGDHNNMRPGRKMNDDVFGQHGPHIKGHYGDQDPMMEQRGMQQLPPDGFYNNRGRRGGGDYDEHRMMKMKEKERRRNMMQFEQQQMNG